MVLLLRTYGTVAIIGIASRCTLEDVVWESGSSNCKHAHQGWEERGMHAAMQKIDERVTSGRKGHKNETGTIQLFIRLLERTYLTRRLKLTCAAPRKPQL